MAFVVVPTIAFTVSEQTSGEKLSFFSTCNFNGEAASVTSAILTIYYYDADDVLQSFDDYDLVAETEFTNFLTPATPAYGWELDIADLTVLSAAPPDKYPDGYYIITLAVTDGTYGADHTVLWPNGHTHMGCMAKYKFMARKMPASILSWPMTDQVRIANQDMFLQRMYLDAAEKAAELTLWDEFKVFMLLIEGIFSYYEIEEIW